MLTKKTLESFIPQYRPGLLRKLGKSPLFKFLGVRNSYSDNMQLLINLIERLPEGALSPDHLEHLSTIISKEKGNTATKKVFDLIQSEIDGNNTLINRLLLRTRYLLNDLKDTLSVAVQTLLHHPTEVLLFTTLACEKLPFESSYLLLGKNLQTATQTWGNSYCENENYTKIVSQLLVFGINCGLDFMNETGGLLMMSYVMGTLSESAATYLLEKSKSSTLLKKNNSNYNQALFHTETWENAGYMLGAFAGVQMFKAMPSLYVLFKADNTDDCLPTILTEREETLLNSRKECMNFPGECRKTALKVLKFNNTENPNREEIDTTFFELMMKRHPDKNKVCDPKLLTAESANFISARHILKKGK